MNAERTGHLLQGVAGLFLAALFGVVFLPGYDGGVGRPAVASAVGVAFCGIAAGRADERWTRVGTTVAVAGSVAATAGAGYILATADAGLAERVAAAAAVVGVVALAANAVAARDRLDGVNSTVVEMGATGSLVGTVVLLNLPPSGDEPFRSLFFALAYWMVAYGAVATAAGIVLGRTRFVDWSTG